MLRDQLRWVEASALRVEKAKSYSLLANLDKIDKFHTQRVATACSAMTKFRAFATVGSFDSR